MANLFRSISYRGYSLSLLESRKLKFLFFPLRPATMGNDKLGINWYSDILQTMIIRKNSENPQNTIVDNSDKKIVVHLHIRPLCTAIHQQHSPPLPFIKVGLPLKPRLGRLPAFKATFSEGEGGVKACYSSIYAQNWQFS